MNRILRKSHTKENIELMKARDYYFDIAKKLNLFKSAIVLFPSVFLLATYILSALNINLPLLKNWGDLIVGGMTVVAAFSVYMIDRRIHRLTDISNQLRALYDHRVLGIQLNRFLNRDTDILKYTQTANKVKYSPRYETWYTEVFSDNHYANVFCCQVDNLLYAKHAYRAAKRLYVCLISAFSCIVLLALVLSCIGRQWITFFLIIFSVLECYEVIFEKIKNLAEAQKMCAQFCEHAKDITPDELNESIIEQTQELVNKNRDLCIFLPRVIRMKFLKDGNPFYQELDAYKHKFMGEDATIPENANEIEVMYEDGSDAIPLCEIQNRLSVMMQSVSGILDAAEITYTLDGGTLIGAMRKAKAFIPWDDDIDIAIPIDQIERAKAVLREQLDYVIQDAESEPFYSPRLSAFKIRESNEHSMISEKDSTLYERYLDKGLFIDVYAYCPILICKPVDKLFRRAFIHPLNRRLEKVETGCLVGKQKEQQFKKFFRLKKRYQQRLSFYRMHANNRKYYAYFPGYVYNLKKAGPYHAAKELYAKKEHRTLWESAYYKIPADPDAILCAYYGKAWKTPPFPTKAELVAKYPTTWYSKAPTKVTALKHIAHILHYKKSK